MWVKAPLADQPDKSGYPSSKAFALHGLLDGQISTLNLSSEHIEINLDQGLGLFHFGTLHEIQR